MHLWVSLPAALLLLLLLIMMMMTTRMRRTITIICKKCSTRNVNKR